MKYIIIVSIFLFACNEKCDFLEKTCDNNKVLVCDDEDNWQVMLDCNQIIPLYDAGPDQWKCCEEKDGELACLPKDQCYGDL